MDGTGAKIVHSALMRSTPPECTRQTRTAGPVVRQRTDIPGQTAHEATRLRNRRTNPDLPRPNRPDRLKRTDRPGQPELRERPEESSGPSGPNGLGQPQRPDRLEWPDLQERPGRQERPGQFGWSGRRERSR